MITEEEYKDMFAKCSKIRKLLVASITITKATIKTHRKKEKQNEGLRNSTPIFI